MLVGRGEFSGIIERLRCESRLAFDTETTGLRPYGGDRLFSVIIASKEAAHYFNFQEYAGLDPEFILPREWIAELSGAFGNADAVYYAHNAKFDMAFLAKEGVTFTGEIHCTEAIARVLKNDLLTYTLKACAERIGLAKDDGVEDYVSREHLWEWEQEPGKTTRHKRKFFDRVPVDLIVPYGKQDALVTFALGEHQEEALMALAAEMPAKLPPITKVVDNERRLTTTLFHVEHSGVLIDRGYCEEAIAHEEAIYKEAANSFEALTGIAFVDSGKCLHEAFTRFGVEVPLTEKGNPSFTDDVLARIDSPVAETVRRYREAIKRCNTYYRSFLWLADRDGALHCNFRQGGTGTGRLSCSAPNLQNVPKEDEGPFPIRRAFIPRPGHFFFTPDYDQMEYRVMLDYAEEIELIEKVKAGVDVHEATAQLMGVDRKTAKTINFMLLYGGGDSKLASALGVSLGRARALKSDYFEALPNVQRFIRTVIKTAEVRGYIFNWAGRRCVFADSRFAYKAPNYLIQGGCADIVKFAMNAIDDFLRGRKSKMLLQIHDEILFEIHESEAHIVHDLRALMESVYPHRALRLTCGMEHSWKSWADKVEGVPDGKETRDGLQGASVA